MERLRALQELQAAAPSSAGAVAAEAHRRAWNSPPRGLLRAGARCRLAELSFGRSPGKEHHHHHHHHIIIISTTTAITITITIIISEASQSSVRQVRPVSSAHQSGLSVSQPSQSGKLVSLVTGGGMAPLRIGLQLPGTLPIALKLEASTRATARCGCAWVCAAVSDSF